MDSTRRSFFGFLGGVAASGAALVPTIAEASSAPLQIDEWDEGGVHRFHIETAEDVDLGVFFQITTAPRQGGLGYGPGVTQTPRQVIIPLVADDVTEFGLKRRMDSVRRLAGEGKPVVHVTHLRRATGVTSVGVAVLPRVVTLDDLKLLVPVRLTSAGSP